MTIASGEAWTDGCSGTRATPGPTSEVSNSMAGTSRWRSPRRSDSGCVTPGRGCPEVAIPNTHLAESEAEDATRQARHLLPFLPARVQTRQSGRVPKPAYGLWPKPHDAARHGADGTATGFVFWVAHRPADGAACHHKPGVASHRGELDPGQPRTCVSGTRQGPPTKRHRFPSRRGAQKSFRGSSPSITLSSAWSATSRFNRPFSSSSSPSRFASPTCRPPYIFFQV